MIAITAHARPKRKPMRLSILMPELLLPVDGESLYPGPLAPTPRHPFPLPPAPPSAVHPMRRSAGRSHAPGCLRREEWRSVSRQVVYRELHPVPISPLSSPRYRKRVSCEIPFPPLPRDIMARSRLRLVHHALLSARSSSSAGSVPPECAARSSSTGSVVGWLEPRNNTSSVASPAICSDTVGA